MKEICSSVCFTGRRPKDLVGYNREGYTKLVDFMRDYIERKLYPQYIEFITGGAQGFDQLVFWAVEKARKNLNDKEILNQVYLPFPAQADRWSEYGPFGKEDYQQMKDHASSIIFTTGTNPQDYSMACKMLQRRNDVMLTDSGMCIGLWPDRDNTWMKPDIRSGTANCLKHAMQECYDVRIVRYGIKGNEVVPLYVERIK